MHNGIEEKGLLNTCGRLLRKKSELKCSHLLNLIVSDGIDETRIFCSQKEAVDVTPSYLLKGLHGVSHKIP